MFKHCAGCHRPGQSAPFSLLSYGDVKKHARDIARVTLQRYMPPWLPEPGYGQFTDERRLSEDDIGTIQQWVDQGALQGNPEDLPAVPEWSGDWQLGKPDLVVAMPRPYTLAAEGRDIYRNFVVPVRIAATRYVRALEFRPDNPRIVHHAFIKVDSTSQSRRLDVLEAEPGFDGMNSPARMPDGHFLGWQPGRRASFLPEGLAWRLSPGDDLIIETHMNPTGKSEALQASIGLYFTDRAPTNTCCKVNLTSYAFDIAAGETNYVVEDSFKLPVDVHVLAVLPHAHYLAKEMQGWATRPDGQRQWLLFIKQWDFNWQGDYRYAQPVLLPAGSTLSMRFTYDNSTNNLRNPNHPPKPVRYGPQSSDEMAELWFQLLPRSSADLARLDQAYQTHVKRLFREHSEYRIRKDPDDAKAHSELGLFFLEEGRTAEAEKHFRAAVRSEPDYAPGHYRLGLLLRRQRKLPEARSEFEAVLRLDPRDFKAHGNLGFISLDQGDFKTARTHFESALRLNPDDALARSGLKEAQRRAKP
jgi:hypothetical protein